MAISPHTIGGHERLAALAFQLGMIDSGDGKWVYGRYRGHPVAMMAIQTVAGPADGGPRPMVSILVQVRHPLRDEEVPSISSDAWSEPLRLAMSARTAKASVEDGIAWLDI